MKSFDFELPTKIRFGAGITQEVGQEAVAMGGSNILIITDKGIMKAGIVDTVVAALRIAGHESIAIFDDVEPNPRDTTVHRAYEQAKALSADLLIAIGGGSSIDTAKGVGVLLEHGGQIKDYEFVDSEMLKKPITPLIAIPTTAGTGSEATCWAVITDTERHFKMSVGGHFAFPKLALVDPDLIVTLPPGIVASTGMDALTHAIEGYTCTVSEPISDAYGLYAIELIANNLREATFTDKKEAKANLLLGSLMAGICFGSSNVAAVHCMAEALGGLYDTPHGIANAMLLPVVMEFNYAADYEKFARVAAAMGEKDDHLTKGGLAYKAVLAVKKLGEDLGIPKMKEIGAKEEDFERLAVACTENMAAGDNVRKIRYSDFLQLYKKAYAL
ncbi:iron-containing alcohol dehydrogenase [Hominibacterium faecale]|uniref:iron-containing alcohol dehydrogenase n=1 Tax=Hominibacterium faecale TaxID=2839743 RepID=UPI0022B29946|nr:iron-containing alcohol dehydrogenase [Hominibacterium faecale]